MRAAASFRIEERGPPGVADAIICSGGEVVPAAMQDFAVGRTAPMIIVSPVGGPMHYFAVDRQDSSDGREPSSAAEFHLDRTKGKWAY